MTTTRINHTGHNHPNTTAARTACRKAMKVEADRNAFYADNRIWDTEFEDPRATGMLQLATVGNGMRLHYIDEAVNTTRCGKAQPVYVRRDSIEAVDCKGCRSKYGQAHG